jgi:competence protein ComEC
MEPGPLVGLCALAAGILAGQHAGPAPSTALVAVGALGLGAAFVTSGRTRVAIAALAFAAAGFAATTRACNGLAQSPFSSRVAHHDAVTVNGVLVDDPSGTQFAVSARVRAEHRTLFAEASGADAMRLRVLQAGDRVVLAGRVTETDARVRWKHVVARIEGARVIAVRSPRGLPAWADALRDAILRGTAPLPPTTRALVAGFLLGDTRQVPTEITAQYRESGLSHLLVVSGENVAFVLALAGPALRRLRLPARTTLALAVVVLFASMTRFEPSVLRASTMAAIALLATLAGRPASRIRILAYAVTALLLVDPFLLHSVGFGLSCGASAGIAFASPMLARRIPGPRFVREPLAVSLAAQLGVLPMLLAVFGSVPVVTPLTNLVAAPAAEAIGVYGFVAGAITTAAPALGPLVHTPTVLLVAWVTAVARAGAAIPLQLDRRGTCAIAAVVAAAIAVKRLRSSHESAHR